MQHFDIVHFIFFALGLWKIRHTCIKQIKVCSKRSYYGSFFYLFFLGMTFSAGINWQCPLVMEQSCADLQRFKTRPGNLIATKNLHLLDLSQQGVCVCTLIFSLFEVTRLFQLDCCCYPIHLTEFFYDICKVCSTCSQKAFLLVWHADFSVCPNRPGWLK